MWKIGDIFRATYRDEAEEVWQVEKQVGNEWICRGKFRREPMSVLSITKIIAHTNADTWTNDNLVNDFEDVPLVGYMGIHLDIRAQGKFEVYEDGQIRRIEILQSHDGKTWSFIELTADAHGDLYEMVKAGIAKTYAGVIQDTITTHHYSRAADKRRYGFY